MGTTILESLKNAKTNLGSVQGIGSILPLFLADQQLHDVVILLEKGFDLTDEIEPLLEKYGDAESVPNKF